MKTSSYNQDNMSSFSLDRTAKKKDTPKVSLYMNNLENSFRAVENFTLASFLEICSQFTHKK